MVRTALTTEERERIAALLRKECRPTYRAIAYSVGRSVQPVFAIALEMEAAGEIPHAQLGKPPLGAKAQTDAERQRIHRAKVRGETTVGVSQTWNLSHDREKASEAGRKGGLEAQRRARELA